MKWIWCLVVALLVVGLVSHSEAAAKIQHFKDDQGTLHICNVGEEPGKNAAEAQPGTQRRRWVYPASAPPLPPSPLTGVGGLCPAPLPDALPLPAAAASPAPVVPPTPEELARDQAVGGSQDQEETTPETEATPDAGQSDSDFGRFRSGGGRR